MVDGILAAAKEAGHDACGGHVRGMFGFFFNKGPVNNFADAAKSDGGTFFLWSLVSFYGFRAMPRPTTAYDRGAFLPQPFRCVIPSTYVLCDDLPLCLTHIENSRAPCFVASKRRAPPLCGATTVSIVSPLRWILLPVWFILFSCVRSGGGGGVMCEKCPPLWSKGNRSLLLA